RDATVTGVQTCALPILTVAGNSATGAPNVAGGYAPSNLVGPQAGLAVSTPGKTSTGVTPADGGFPGPNDTWNWLGNYKKFPVSKIGRASGRERWEVKGV